jgi:P-type Ca2+ transporter type 2C
VGDIAILEPGEIVPCDGVFLRGHNVRCDESGATGESDAIRKAPYQECMDAKERGEKSKRDCFIVSGSKVIEGVGLYVVIAVGTKSFNGRIMMGNCIARVGYSPKLTFRPQLSEEIPRIPHCN